MKMRIFKNKIQTNRIEFKMKELKTSIKSGVEKHKTQHKKHTRREFLIASALALVGGKMLVDTCLNEYDKYILRRINYELPNYIHLSKNITKTDYGGGGSLVEKVQRGYGIVVNNKYIQPAHITNNGQQNVRTPFGLMTVDGKVKEQKVYLYNKELEIEKLDYERDVGVFKVPNNFLKNFPCEPKKKVSIGEEVYLIGNPRLTGLNIRKGRISALEGISLDGTKEDKTLFGVDISIHPGDSGCPIVNKDFKLMGLADSTFGAGWGYVTKIEEYL